MWLPRYLACDPDTKRPIGTGWQLLSFDEPELIRRFANNPQLVAGLLLGPSSNDPAVKNGSDAVDVECDSAGAQEEYDKLFAGVAPTPGWASTRGSHSLFRWDDRLIDLKAAFKINGVEYRLGGSKSAHSVCPPSTVGGVRREWLPGRSPDDCEPQPLPEHVIQLLLDYKSARCFHAKDFEPQPFAGFDELEKLGHELENRSAAKIQAFLKGFGFEIACVYRADGVIELYLDRCPFKPADQEEKDGAPLVYVNNDGSYVFTCLHAKDAGKTWEDVETALGAQLNEPSAISSQEPFPDWFDKIVVSPDGAKEKKDIYPYVSARELVSRKYDLTYLVEDVLVAGQPCVIAGPEKCFKTLISLDLAVSLASGSAFLGHFKVPKPVRVLVVSGESGMPTLRAKFATFCKARNIDIPDNLFFGEDENPMPQFVSPKHMQTLSNTIEDSGAKVVVIDPQYLCLDEIEHADASEMGSALRKVNSACKKCGATLVIDAHFRKQKLGDEFKRPTLSEISQAGSREFFRQWLLLWKRSLFKSGKIKLSAEINGSAGHNGDWAIDFDEGTREAPCWNVTVEPLSKEIKQDAVAEIREKIMRVIDGFPDGVVKTKLFRAANVHNEYHKETALASLLIDGCLVSFETVGGNHRPCEHYKRKT